MKEGVPKPAKNFGQSMAGAKAGQSVDGHLVISQVGIAPRHPVERSFG